jgi:hypothetical protein
VAVRGYTVPEQDTLAWPVRGRDQVKAFVAQFHAANPGLRVTLHDEFVSPDGTRACFRFVIHFHNTGPFYGNPPTRAGDGERDARGQAARRTDRRAVRRRQQLPMPHQELVTWAMDFPRDTPDPSPVLTEARRDAQPTM